MLNTRWPKMFPAGFWERAKSGFGKAICLVGAILILGLGGPFTADGEELDNLGYPIFDASEHTASGVVKALYDNVHVRLRMGFYEEALVAGLQTGERFDGKLSFLDQAMLDELIAKCLMINDAEFEKALSLFESANRIRTGQNLHEEADAKHFCSVREGLSSRFRLPFWAAQCALADGDRTQAARLFGQAHQASAGLFGGDFDRLLAAAIKTLPNHNNLSIDTYEALDDSYWQFWDDLGIWSRLTLGMLESGEMHAQLRDAEFARKMKSIILSDLLRWNRTWTYRTGTTLWVMEPSVISSTWR